MGKLLLLGLLAGLGALLASRGAREEAMELARDLSDVVVVGLLRLTSGFADDLTEPSQQEERERRLRWRRLRAAASGVAEAPRRPQSLRPSD